MTNSDAQPRLIGEYKVPTGKLVRVELETADGVITAVSVSGDFFLEPDEALDDINQAMIGASTSASTAELAATVEARLAPTAHLVGFDANAVAVAAGRALGRTGSWDGLVFDVIPPMVLHPAWHVAMDEVIAAEVGAGKRHPTLRFWDWDRPLVVIGSFQSVRNEVDETAADRYGISVVRRITGGGAMFMEPGNCITYSLVVPGELVTGMSYRASYEYLDRWVVGALASVGITAHYVPLNDIASDVGKIGGAAQRRFVDGTVLHHVTMSYDIDADKMMQVLRIGREKLSDKGTTSSNKRVDPMRSQTGLPRQAIIDAFIDHFMRLYQCQLSNYTAEELIDAEELAATKFTSPQWTYRVP